jgi:hypothetical protein
MSLTIPVDLKLPTVRAVDSKLHVTLIHKETSINFSQYVLYDVL